MYIFAANAKYNDLKGSIAADKSRLLDDFLTSRTQLRADEHVIGISVSIGENHGSYSDPILVTCLVARLDGHSYMIDLIQNGQPLKARRVSVRMNIADFLSAFKRVSFTLSDGGLLDQVTYEEEEHIDIDQCDP